MDLDFEPETLLETAALRFADLMQKVATLIMIRRRNEGNTATDPWESFTRTQWSDVLIKINSLAREEFVPAIAEVRGITTEAAEAEYEKMIADTFVPQSQLEHAWRDSIPVLHDVLKLIEAHREERREKEMLDAPLKTEGLEIQDMTDPGETAIEGEKLAVLNTELHKTRGMASSKGDDAVKKLKAKAKAIRATEAGAVARLKKAEIRLDKLLPESYIDW